MPYLFKTASDIEDKSLDEKAFNTFILSSRSLSPSKFYLKRQNFWSLAFGIRTIDAFCAWLNEMYPKYSCLFDCLIAEIKNSPLSADCMSRDFKIWGTRRCEFVDLIRAVDSYFLKNSLYTHKIIFRRRKASNPRCRPEDPYLLKGPSGFIWSNEPTLDTVLSFDTFKAADNFTKSRTSYTNQESVFKTDKRFLYQDILMNIPA